MRRFAALFDALDASTSTLHKVQAMAAYFREAPPEDAAWALYFLTGRRIKRLIGLPAIRAWTMELTGLAPWLFEEAYSSVGDLAEAVALTIDAQRDHSPEAVADVPLHVWIEDRILPLRGLDEPAQRERVTAWWLELDRRQLFLVNKLLTGAFRVGVSEGLVARALAQVSGLTQDTVAHRLIGDWKPEPGLISRLLAPEDEAAVSRPYPFFLASPLEQEVESLGDRADWLAEWKWDGIRAQLVRRGGEVFLWSRGEELITDRFPEIRDAGRGLPEGCVLDGEVLAWRDGRVLPFQQLQQRINRQKLSAKMLADLPAVFMVYDLLELEGQDLREQPLRDRRAKLEAVVDHLDGGAASRRARDHGPRQETLWSTPGDSLLVSPRVPGEDWAALARARDLARDEGVEGLMLKRLESPYRTGRKRGDWWKWKIAPFTVDAVLVYAQVGHGRRANLFTDYTFAVWQDGVLVPIAKAYSGLTDVEINRLDAWIRRHVKERFGPVRSVEPVQVFELAFEGIALSPRHKSGIAVRFPRILRWRTDKRPEEADTLENIKRLLGGGDAEAPAGEA